VSSSVLQDVGRLTVARVRVRVRVRVRIRVRDKNILTQRECQKESVKKKVRECAILL
jgi:hypothetical protein